MKFKVIIHGNYEVDAILLKEVLHTPVNYNIQKLKNDLQLELIKDARNAGLTNVRVLFVEGLE